MYVAVVQYVPYTAPDGPVSTKVPGGQVSVICHYVTSRDCQHQRQWQQVGGWRVEGGWGDNLKEG